MSTEQLCFDCIDQMHTAWRIQRLILANLNEQQSLEERVAHGEYRKQE